MSPQPSVGEFGTKLREARERKGVSLRDIAERTKISVRALEALEQEDISRLPGGIFSRAFVRSYAAEVGLDPERAVEDFVRGFPDDVVTAGHPSVVKMEDTQSFVSDQRMATVVLRLVAISVPLAGLLLYFGFAGRRPRTTVAPSTAGVVVQAEAPGAANADAVVARLNVEVSAKTPCAVSATIDEQPSFDVQLQPGSRQTFDVGTGLLLTVSDPAAVEWTINGAAGRSLGPAGAAATIQLTLGNYKEYLVAR